MYVSSILAAAHKELCCSICVDLLDAPVMMPCGHCFCSRCATRSLEHLSRCPLCKMDVKARSVMDLPLLARVVALSRDVASAHGVEDLAFASQWSQPTPAIGRSPALNAATTIPNDAYPGRLYLSSLPDAVPDTTAVRTQDGGGGSTAVVQATQTQIVDVGGPAASPSNHDSMTPWRRWCTPSAAGDQIADDDLASNPAGYEPHQPLQQVQQQQPFSHAVHFTTVPPADAGNVSQQQIPSRSVRWDVDAAPTQTMFKPSSSDDQQVLLLTTSDDDGMQSSSPAPRSVVADVAGPPPSSSSRWLPRRPSGSGRTPRVTPPLPIDVGVVAATTAAPDAARASSNASPRSGQQSTASTPTKTALATTPCCLCHLALDDRNSVGRFLTTILRNDPSCDVPALRAMDEATLGALLGALCGPFPASRKRRRCEGCDDDGNVFAHYSCLLWSPEVVVDAFGAMMNVDKALRRGPTLRCAFCSQKGATLGCSTRQCRRSYHIPCALLCGAAVCTVDPKRLTLQCAQHAAEPTTTTSAPSNKKTVMRSGPSP